jgi:hypothetical protein
MAVLILTPRQVPDADELAISAQNVGWTVCRLRNWRVDPIPNETEIAVYGEHLFVEAIAQQLGLSLLEPPLDWLERLPGEYLKRRVRFSKLGELAHAWFPSFIKPADDKSFTAQVYQTYSDFPDVYNLPPSTPVLISEPVSWEVEFRCFIRDRQFFTISAYKRYRELLESELNPWYADADESRAAISFIQTILMDRRILIPPSLVIDIGLMEGNGWAVIEANPAWASGIYGCDPLEVLYTIARGCRPSLGLTIDDSIWVIQRTDDVK